MTTLYKHPEYRQNQDDWILARDLYEGCHETLVKKYLWYHAIECIDGDKLSSTLRRLREERTRYLNITEILVSIWQSLFFRVPPKPNKELKELLDEHGGEANIDGQGTSLESFAKNKVLVSLLNYGKACIITDAFPIQPRNLAEQKANKIRPYMDLIWPLDAVDWSEETGDPARIGEFNFFRHEYYGVLPRATPSEEPKCRKFSQAFILNGEKVDSLINYVDIDENFKPIKEHYDAGKGTEVWQGGDRLPTSFKAVPVTVINGEMWLYDANQESLRFFNIRSNKDNILHQQGYQDKYLKGISPSQIAEYAKAFNEYSYKILPENGDAIVLEPIQLTGYENAEAEALRNAFKAGLNKLNSIPSDSKEAPGADAQVQEKEYTYALVESTLGEIENGLNQAFQHYAAFLSKDNFEGRVELNKHITPESFGDFIQVHGIFRDILAKVDGYDKAAAEKAIKRCRFDSEIEKDLLKTLEGVDLSPEARAEDEKDDIGEALNGR